MPSKRVALVGNSTFPLDAATGAQVVDQIKSLGPDCTLLTRKRPAFDQFIQHCAIILGLRCLTYDADGGASNIERDETLVRDCDELHGFLTLDEFEQGVGTGTRWLIDKALKAGKATYAYTVVDGLLIYVGSEAARE
jgi:hypothetical protein